MPRFHFHVADDSDEEGTVLPNFVAAKTEAIKLAGALIREEAGSFWDKGRWGMTVTNGDGLRLLQLLMVGAVSPKVSTKNTPALL